MVEVTANSPGAKESLQTMIRALIDPYRPDGLDDYAQDMRNFDPPARPEAGFRADAEASPGSIPPYSLCTYFHSSEYSNGTVKRQREPFALAVRYGNDPCAHLLPTRGREKRQERGPLVWNVG